MTDNLGWGKITNEGIEIWDTNPVFLGDTVTLKDWLKLLFYPKKFLLYRWIKKNIPPLVRQRTDPSRVRIGEGLGRVSTSVSAETPSTPPPTRGRNIKKILDVGCGTGASVIDLKRIFGRRVDLIGVDVVKLQVDLAQKKIKKYGVVAQVLWYDGYHLPFADASFDAIYTSDVLGHVSDVPAWLRELNRVLKPGGALAMFSESKLGKHAWIRKYLFDRGLNVDPHAQFHISLYSKSELQSLLHDSGFMIHAMHSVFWPAFLLHPEEFSERLEQQENFPLLRAINRLLSSLKKKTHPYTTAIAELYGLIEMVTIGRWIESQGYVILARKKERQQ